MIVLGVSLQVRAPAEKTPLHSTVTFVAQEHINHPPINDLPMLIHRTIQVEFLLAAKAEHIIHCPFLPDPR
jgi:hypothetical protein